MASPVEANQANGRAAGRGAATMVAAGIFFSRFAGLIRDRVFAHYFGNTDAADAFRAAFRIPNFLQNLFGEGVLSASFIPVYARLRAEQKDEEAGKLAEAIFALLLLATTVLVALGIFATPWLIDAIAPGFHGEKRELTVRLVRILFPGAGLLVFSAFFGGGRAETEAQPVEVASPASVAPLSSETASAPADSGDQPRRAGWWSKRGE